MSATRHGPQHSDGAFSQPDPAPPRYGLGRAAVRAFFRFLVLSIALVILFLVIYAQVEDIADAELGYIAAHALWFVFDIDVEPADEALALAALVPFGLALALTLGFLPTINAVRRHHPWRAAVFLVNVLFGWNPIGWLIALAFSAIDVDRFGRLRETLEAAQRRRSSVASDGAGSTRTAPAETPRPWGEAERRRQPEVVPAAKRREPATRQAGRSSQPTVQRRRNIDTSWRRER